jgi:N-acetylmuramoyl-L-alanine amidase
MLPSPLLAGARLQSATLDAQAASATLTLGLSADVQAHVFTLPTPNRLVVDLPGTQRGAALSLPAASGPVAAVRGAPHERGGYRLVLEWRGDLPAAPRLTRMSTPNGYRLQVSCGDAPPSAAIPAAVPAVATAPAAAQATPVLLPAAAAARVVQPQHSPGRTGRDIIVAIDAGHGGEDPGASGPAGTHEKDVTLAIARALAARINDRAGMRAVLTRDSDRLVDLRERFERARNAHADLFVSIHADSVRDRSITGASVYTLSYRGASSEAARWLADRENAAVLKGGVSLAGVNPNLASVLLDAAQSANMGASVEAANEVLAALDGVGAVRKRIVQHAGFMVLKSPDVPSMLVETAYISNPAEEQNLRSSAYQARLARAVEAGVVAYFQRHPPDGTHYANARHAEDTAAGDSGV